MALADVERTDRRIFGRRPELGLWLTILTATLLLVGLRPTRFSRATSRLDRSTQRLNADAGYEPRRGRSADTPSEIPARGWKDILWRVYQNIGDDRVVALAAGVTFYSILALFPAIAAFVALYGLFANPATIAAQLDNLSAVLPGGAVRIIGDEIQRISAQGNDTLGITFVVGLAVALWSANAGMKSLFDTLNIVYKEREARSFIALNAISLTFTTAAIAFVLIAVGAMVVLPVILKFVGLDSATELLAKILRWPALLAVVLFGLAVLFRYGPSRAKPKWRWVTWGAAFAAIAWLVASLLFTWYAANFGSYNKTYGSLGAIIGFMIWIWLSVIVILLGAELDAEMEHQTLRDTTTGRPKLLGFRGATMADTVGPSRDSGDTRSSGHFATPD
jgi:membrane protein